MSLKPTNPDELQDICNSFKEDKAPVYDNIDHMGVSAYLSLIGGGGGGHLFEAGRLFE